MDDTAEYLESDCVQIKTIAIDHLLYLSTGGYLGIKSSNILIADIDHGIEAVLQDDVISVCEKYNLTLKIYRTYSGFRAIALNRFIPIGNMESLKILAELHSDSLYVDYCIEHGSYRARLTPKYWRNEFSVCRHYYTHGLHFSPQKIADFVRLHDSVTLVNWMGEDEFLV